MNSLAPRRKTLPRLSPREEVEVVAHRSTMKRHGRHHRRRVLPPGVATGVRAWPPPPRQAHLAQQVARNVLNQQRHARGRGAGATGELPPRLCNRGAARRRKHQLVARVSPDRAVKRAHTPRGVGERGVPQRVVRGGAHQEVGQTPIRRGRRLPKGASASLLLLSAGLLDEHELLLALRCQLRELPRAHDVRVDVPAAVDVQDRDPRHVGAHHARRQRGVRAAHAGQREHEPPHLLVGPVVHAPGWGYRVRARVRVRLGLGLRVRVKVRVCPISSSDK